MKDFPESVVLVFSLAALYLLAGVLFGLFGGVTYLVGRWFVNLVG